MSYQSQEAPCVERAATAEHPQGVRVCPGNFRTVSIAETRGHTTVSNAGALRRYYVTVNNNVEGVTITGLSFKVWYCGPRECYGPRSEYYNDFTCAPGHSIEVAFETPTLEDCASCIEDLVIHTSGSGGYNTRRQAAGKLGDCSNEFIFWLSNSVERP